MATGDSDQDVLSSGDAAFDNDRKPSSSDTSVAAAVVEKVCCVCGCDLHGQTRYKDTSGKYWCVTCNQADADKKQPATCPDCNAAVSKGDLVDFKGTSVCPTCWDKRRVASKREEARVRAVEEQAEEDAVNRRRWVLAIGTGLAVLAIYGLLMVLFSTSK